MEDTEASSRTEDEEVKQSKKTIISVFKIVGTRIPQRDLISLLLVSPWLYKSLVSCPSLWLALDFHEMKNAGNRLIDALALFQYQHVKKINLAFAQHVEDEHFSLLKEKRLASLQELECLNLNACQKISDEGVKAMTSACPKLKVFSIYWNIRLTDLGIAHLVKHCKHIVDLNLSGCKNITDKSLQLIADNYPELDSLNLTRCVKLTDGGLQQILLKCSSLQHLNLYAMPSFTDEAYKKISLLENLRFLDLCGAANLSDLGLSSIAQCKNMVSLNLTWCKSVTDVGVIAIAEGCTSLELLSLHGNTLVTNKCIEALSSSCSNTITTLDVYGCSNIKKRQREDLLQYFPNLKCFKVHS